MKTSRLVLVVVLWLALAGRDDIRAAIPRADDPKAYTEHTYRRQLLDFNNRTIVQAYQRFGHRKGPWNDAAKTLLAGAAIHLTNVGVNDRDQIPDEPSLVDLAELGRTCVESGCDDPLVLSMYAIVVMHEGYDCLPLVDQAMEAFPKFRYPPYRVAGLAREVLREIDNQNPGKFDKYTKALFDADVATLKLKNFGPIDRRIFIHDIRNDMQLWPADRQRKLFDAARQKDVDPWLGDMVQGYYRVSTGWAARGTGFASTVTEQGGRIFDAELDAAKACLQRADDLEPKFPEAASKMITIAMAEGDKQACRTWFERAVKGQFDFAPAYSAYRQALSPLWLGDDQQRYDFACECADTARFDTSVPFEFLETLHAIRERPPQGWDWWHKPGVWERLRGLFERYSEQALARGEREYYYSKLIGYGWQLGKYDDARKDLEKIKDHIDAKSMASTGALGTRSLSGVYALTGANGATLRKAEADAADGKFDEAIAAYAPLAAKAKADDREFVWLRGRLQELKWIKAFNAGETVNLIPAQSPSGWYATHGEFGGDGTSIIGKADAKGAALICGVEFGREYELRGTIEILAPEDGSGILPHCDAGVLFDWDSSIDYYGLYFRPVAQEAVWVGYLPTPWIGSRHVDPQTHFMVRLMDGKADVEFDGQSFLKHVPAASSAAIPHDQIGIGASNLQPGTSFRVTELKIKKLAGKENEKPATAAVTRPSRN